MKTSKEDIIRMAQEAGFDEWQSKVLFDFPLERFAALVAAAEREACEALYSHEDVQAPVGNSAWGEAYQDGWIDGAQAYRNAIRTRGQT